MIDERAYELLCSQLGLANEEKTGLRKQVNELIARLTSIEKSNNENSNALMDIINELKDTIECYRHETESIKKQLEAKDEVIKLLCMESENLKLQLGNSRKHRFGRTSEQKRLLNNRNTDESAMDKSEFDGSDKKDAKDASDSGNGEGGSTPSGCESPQKGGTTRRKETSPRAEKTQMKVDKIVTHEIDDYYQLPPGAGIMNRNGMPDVWEYSVIEHVRAHNVEHAYKVARVKLADGSFVNTMEHPLKSLGGVFSPELLARLLCLKYDFSMPENRQIRLRARDTCLNVFFMPRIATRRRFYHVFIKREC